MPAVGQSGESGQPRLEQARSGTVHIGGRDRPFAELDADDARAQAAELKGAGTFGPLQRVVKVAIAWGELAGVMEQAGAATVGDLDDETVLTYAERVWVIPPAEGMI